MFIRASVARSRRAAAYGPGMLSSPVQADRFSQKLHERAHALAC